MLGVIDYGGGNLGSLIAALERRNVAFRMVESGAQLAEVDAAILPGDGAFGATMDGLRARGLDVAILDLIQRDRPFFGICVGMQILFERSTEHGVHLGLGVLPGTVERLDERAPRVPHMGWNKLEMVQQHPIVQGLGHDEYVYFLHSYRVAVGAATIAAAEHGERFSAIVARGNTVATQFHPEKSQHTGAKILDNFLAMMESNRAVQTQP
jgi:glutamine amidotransferase